MDCRVVKLLDHFEHRGPHGKHVCMVYIYIYIYSLIYIYIYSGIPLDILRVITRQVAQGLDFLHRQCHIIHTDLKPENILLKHPLWFLLEEKPGADANSDAIQPQVPPSQSTTAKPASGKNEVDEAAQSGNATAAAATCSSNL